MAKRTIEYRATSNYQVVVSTTEYDTLTEHDTYGSENYHQAQLKDVVSRLESLVKEVNLTFPPQAPKQAFTPVTSVTATTDGDSKAGVTFDGFRKNKLGNIIKSKDGKPIPASWFTHPALKEQKPWELNYSVLETLTGNRG